MNIEHRPAEGRGLTRHPSLFLLLFFLITQGLYYLAGVRFDARPVDTFFQIADPLLLKTRLLETLYYLHMQPPGFNLIVGIVLKLFPVHFGAALHAIYMFCGATMCFTIYRLMRILGARPGIAMVLTGIFLASPGVVMFENLLIYEYLLMAILCATALMLCRLLQHPTFAIAIAFFLTLTWLVYLRALFHLAWFVMLAAFVLWLLKGRRKMILAASALPLVLCVALFAKNWYEFGTFGSSTWMGFNAEVITLFQLTDAEHQELMDRGILSRVSLIPTYRAITEFKDFITLPPPTGIPVLDQPYDSTGRVNHNNLGYLVLHAATIADAKKVLRYFPVAYYRSFRNAWSTYFLPSGDFSFFDLNRPRIFGFDRAFNIIFFGQRYDYAVRRHFGPVPLNIGLYLVIGLPLLFVLAIKWMLQEVRALGWTPRAALLAFMLFNIAFITASVTLLSTWEDNRYRLPLDPFFVSFLAVALSRIKFFAKQ